MPSTATRAANVAIDAKNWLGKGWQGAKTAWNHETVKSARDVIKAGGLSLKSGDFAGRALSYGVLGGATGYVMSDDPKRGIRNGVALGVLGAAGHTIYKNPAVRGAVSSFGASVEKLTKADPLVDSLGRRNPGAARTKAAAAARRANGAASTADVSSASAAVANSAGVFNAGHAEKAAAASAAARQSRLATEVEQESSARLIPTPISPVQAPSYPTPYSGNMMDMVDNIARNR